MSLNQKIVAVTGANGSLGRAVVDLALSEGARVAMLDIAFSDDRDELPAERVSQHIVDLTDADQTRNCVASIGPVDVLCNIAGGFAMGTTVYEATDAEWDAMLKLNVFTMLNGIRAVVPGMIDRGAGSIVSVAALGALNGAALMAPYIVAKSAVMRITESLSEELKGQGIRVNCVLPSIIDTAPNRQAMPDADFATWVRPEQLAKTICFLASDLSDGVHGACVPVKNLV